MMPLTLLGLVWCLLWVGQDSTLPALRFIQPDAKTGTSLAVVVGDAPLVHTSQLLPLDRKGQLVGKDRPAEQIAKVLDNLSLALKMANSDFGNLVKINVYATRTAIVDEAKKALAERLRDKAKPAISFVVGALSHPDAVIAMDAVAVSPREDLRHSARVGSSKTLPPTLGGSHLGVLPVGPSVYIAGQAEKGDLPEATRKTMESLRATLKFLQLDTRQIVQVKAFLTPMSRVAEVERELAKFFGDQPVPPVVFVEWKSSLPIEIELIAAAPRPKEKPADAIDFLTPPRMKASPIYSRVTRINYGKTVYVSGLYGLNGKDATGEVEEIFTTLGDVLKKSGSDMRHLVKATYYVSRDDTSTKLNELRPKYYDPKRPPSASKAMVPGVGVEGRGITLDMIAVVKP